MRACLECACVVEMSVKGFRSICPSCFSREWHGLNSCSLTKVQMGLFTPENYLQYVDDYISNVYVAKHENARGVVGGRSLMTSALLIDMTVRHGPLSNIATRTAE